jgi:hypothetical protein
MLQRVINMVFVPLIFAFAVVGFCCLDESYHYGFGSYLGKVALIIGGMVLVMAVMFATVLVPFYIGLTGGAAMACIMGELMVIAALLLATVL